MDKWIKKAKTEIKWVAVDFIGDVYGYTVKPFKQTCAWTSLGYDIYLGKIKDYKGDWKKSLTKVK